MNNAHPRWGRWCAYAAIPLVICAVFHPVNSGVLRLITIGAIMTTLLALWLGNWSNGRSKKVNQRRHRLWLLACVGIGILPLLLPNRSVDAIALRQEYIQALTRFEDTRYHWGGETHMGIDCSGLPRRALQQAMLRQGVKQLNGGLIRQALAHWWFDASAAALAEGYRDYTIPVRQASDVPSDRSTDLRLEQSFGDGDTIRTMDYGDLAPGDFGVTGDRQHLIVYLGNDHWIQADPGTGRVLTLNGHRDDNQWFHHPITMHRWAILASTNL